MTLLRFISLIILTISLLLMTVNIFYDFGYVGFWGIVFSVCAVIFTLTKKH